MELAYDPPPRFRDALDQLHDTAGTAAGADDFGPGDYLPGLAVLLQSMDYDPRFSDTGRRAAWGMLVEVLGGRAHAVAAMKANPGFDAVPIPADPQLSPVVIVGVPRTGTTALHRLMAVDPRFQGLQTWLLDHPMPRPPIETWGDYPEFRRTHANLEAQHSAAPGGRAAHYRAAEEVHECCMVLRQAFVSNLWSCGWSAPTYDAWWQSASEAPAYAWYKQGVQLIGSSEVTGGVHGKRWLLKNPGHIAQLDLLFAVFPGARVIQTHRDPAKAVPSLVSLLMRMHPIMEDGRAEQRGAIMLRREVAKWSDAVTRCEAVRARYPGHVLDVVHADFHRDPEATLERIYRFIGMDIPDETRAGFARRIAEKPELQHGLHRYSIADYGMSEDEARAPFADYIARYDLVETAR